MNKIVHFIVHSKVAAYTATLLCIVVWAFYAVERGNGIDVCGSLGMSLCVLMGYLSVRVGREHSFTGMKDMLPATLFFMGVAMAPQMIPGGVEDVHLILFPLACYLLLRTYRNRMAMGNYFLAFALIGVECLLSAPLLLVLPWLVLCGIFMESLHGRTLFAALWGLLFPYWVIGSVLFLTDKTFLAVSYFEHILPSTPATYSLGDTDLWISPPGLQLLWALLLALPGSVMILFDRTMKLQVSAGFRLLIVSLLVLLVAIAVFPAYYSALFPCVLSYASLIGAVFFLKNRGRAKNIYLVLLLILWLFSLNLTYGVIF